MVSSKKGILLISFYFLVVLLLSSCQKNVVFFKLFTFPSNSKVELNNWQYKGKLLIVSKSYLYKADEKYAYLEVVDKNGVVVLEDLSLLPNVNWKQIDVEWSKFNNLKIEIKGIDLQSQREVTKEYYYDKSSNWGQSNIYY